MSKRKLALSVIPFIGLLFFENQVFGVIAAITLALGLVIGECGFITAGATTLLGLTVSPIFFAIIPCMLFITPSNLNSIAAIVTVIIGTIMQFIEGEPLTGFALLFLIPIAMFSNMEKEVTKQETKAREEKLEDITNKANRDGLTKLYNHDYLMDKMQEWKDENEKIIFCILDLDHFKSVNDTYGHEFGNVVLKRFAKLLKNYETETIVPARYGGEEFSLMFRQTKLNDAEQLVNDIKDEFSNFRYRENKENPDFQITFSAGVAPCKNKEDESESVKRADDALYMAKKKGRNRVIIKDI